MFCSSRSRAYFAVVPSDAARAQVMPRQPSRKARRRMICLNAVEKGEVKSW